MLIHKDKDHFLSLCKKLVEKLGNKEEVIVLGKESEGKIYEDEVIYISISKDYQCMEIQRKLNGHSLMYMVNGSILYFHGEFIYLVDHVMQMLTKDNS